MMLFCGERVGDRDLGQRLVDVDGKGMVFVDGRLVEEVWTTVSWLKTERSRGMLRTSL